MRHSIATLLPRALFTVLAACSGGTSDVAERSSPVAAAVTPTLSLGDTFVPFHPGLFGYDRERGSTEQRAVFINFGSTTNVVAPSLDILPHDDAPDHKMRVRITISDSDPLQNPSGDIWVHGKIWERNWLDPTQPPSSAPVSEQLHFVTNGTKTTTLYFDEVDTIETTGLGMDVELEVELWSGHEQEMGVAVTIDGITDQITCEDEYRVYFNGQIAYPDWSSASATCVASLLPGGFTDDGTWYPSPARRGMYFGLVTDDDTTDAFHHFKNPVPDPSVSSGHTSFPSSWQDWLNDLPFGASFFDVDENATDETRVRTIVVELERQSDLQVVDAARMMLTIATDAFGNPGLVARLGTDENPGAIAQLSPRGLDRLEPTHASTLPYPIAPAGTQPRLSQSAIAAGAHTSPELVVDLDELPPDDLAYWTEPNPAPQPNEGEFAGYLAYQDILASARAQKQMFDFAMQACNASPNPAVCQTGVRATFCVEDTPSASDFRIRITGIDTYFDPERPESALTVGNVTGMQLTFGANQILSDYTLEAIQGWLMASIDPANIQLEWDKDPLDPCTKEPEPRTLADYPNGVDYEEWLVCRDLSFYAASGTLADPLAFDIAKNGEEVDTPLASGPPTVTLADIAVATGTGICVQEWAQPTLETEVLAWQPSVEALVAADIATSPSQDEALNRLLSPYELGVERIDAPPPGTPPYDVHPLATYDLSATIGKTTADLHGAQADATHGLYIPYLTRSSPSDAVPFFTWFCPVISGQQCNGLEGVHEPMLFDGLDPDGDPYDVAINYTTAHINQALWAQARRADHLGSPAFPGRLAIADTAVVDLAAALGYTDVVDALAPLGSRFGVRYYHEAAPYTIITDGSGFTPPKMIYVTPNIIVELVAIAGDGTETVVAKYLVDVVDRNLQVELATGGVPDLTASWGDLQVLSMTSTHVPNCYGTITGVNSCEDRLRLVVGALWWPAVEHVFLDMIERTPALQLFDAAGESGNPRHLKNVRTFLVNEGLLLVADLCKPGNVDCE